MPPSKKDRSLAERTKSGLAWNASLKIITQVVRLTVGIILARILDPVDFGIMAIGHMVINYTNTISDFGFMNALVQKKELEPIHINSVFTINLGISVFLSLLVAIFSTQIGRFFNSPESANVLLAMSFLFVVRTFRDINEAQLRRDVLFKIISTVGLLESFSMSAIALALALLGWHYWSLVWSTMLATVFSALVFQLKVKQRPRLQYSHEAMKSIYGFGLWNFFRVQLFFINQYMTQLVVARLFGPVSLGYFEKSQQVASAPRESIAAQINSVMFSSFSRLQHDTHKLTDWFLKVATLECIFVVPVLAGIISVADQFVIVLLGEKWIPSIVPLQILSAGVIFQLFNGLIASLNVGVGLYRRQALRETPGTLIFILLCFFLSKWGLDGVSFAYFGSMVFISIVTFDLSRKSLKIQFRQLMSPVAPYLGTSLLMVLFVMYVKRVYLAEYCLRNLILLVVSGGGFYVVLIMLVNVLTKKHCLFPLRQ